MMLGKDANCRGALIKYFYNTFKILLGGGWGADSIIYQSQKALGTRLSFTVFYLSHWGNTKWCVDSCLVVHRINCWFADILMVRCWFAMGLVVPPFSNYANKYVQQTKCFRTGKKFNVIVTWSIGGTGISITVSCCFVSFTIYCKIILLYWKQCDLENNAVTPEFIMFRFEKYNKGN